MSYRVGIDVGGTFTDLALWDETTGELKISKAPSNPESPIEAVSAVIDLAGLSYNTITNLIHGTTVATNALLERKKATPGLITTKGFRDVVFIQRMNRKHHYDLGWDKPTPFVERRHCLEVCERVDYKGDVVSELKEDDVRQAVLQLKREGVHDIAVAFLFSFLNPCHELRVREIIGDLFPEATVSLSHEVYPRWREYDRVSTTLADAFLKSLVGDYLGNLAEGLHDAGLSSELLVMKSNGGIEDHRAAAAKPVDLLVSGPVGGVLSAMFLGDLTGRRNLISMDMGGTSLDVSLIADGRAKHTAEFEIEWGLPVYTPMLDVRTIGAGGGSVAWIDKGGLLRVGPRSAGATPGPVCYRRGGTEPTVTDANVVLGRINPRYFLGGKFELDEEAARLALRRLGEELSMSVEEVAGSIVELVDFNMVDAIRLVSIDRGLDPREFTLVSFGGAGSLHAGSLAEIIGIGDVLVPIHQGVFSALGLMTADMRVDESVTANFRSDLLYIDRLNALFDRVRHGSLARLHAEGYRGSPVVEESIEMRYLGQNYSTEVALPEHSGVLGEADLEEVYSRFHAEHRRLYGYDIPAEIVEFVTVKVTAIGVTDKPTVERLERRGDLTAKGHRRVFFRVDARWTDLETAVYERDLLPPGAWLDGPAVIEEETSTTLVHPSQRLEVDEYGNLFIHTTVGGHPR